MDVASPLSRIHDSYHRAIDSTGEEEKLPIDCVNIIANEKALICCPN